MKKNKDSRRNFLKKSVVIPSIMILPRHVLGGKDFISPSDKLNIAGIGVRKWGMGANNLWNPTVLPIYWPSQVYLFRLYL